MLGQNAVHGVMAGYTSFSTGLCNNRIVYLPIRELLDSSPRTVTPFGRTIERVISITGQPEPKRERRMSTQSLPFSSVGNGL